MTQRPDAYLPPATVAREQSRRRALLVSIGAVMLLSISPVLGHHVARGADAMLSGTDRIGELCLVALHVLLAPVHGAFHVALLAGIVYAAWDRVRAWRRSASILGQLDAKRPLPNDPFWVAARAVGLDPAILRVVSGLPNPAFTVGWLEPRIFVANELLGGLSESELRAILAHEGAHVARRDPLRLGVLRFLAHVVFWIPALRRLAADLADESEIQADDVAARHDPLAVASAIISIASWGRPSRAPAGVLGFVSASALLERRVRRLAGEDTAVGTHVTRRSIAGASAMLVLVWVSGAVMAHPLPAMPAHAAAGAAPFVAPSALDADATNCRRHREPALAHLLCRKVLLADGRAHCPHEPSHAHG